MNRKDEIKAKELIEKLVDINQEILNHLKVMDKRISDLEYEMSKT